MVELIYPILSLVIGLAAVYQGGRFLLDAEYAQRYVATSPKAWLWRKVLGQQKATSAIKSVFAPLAIAIGAFCAGYGIYLFFI